MRLRIIDDDSLSRWAWKMKSRGLKVLQLEVGTPRLLVWYISCNIWRRLSRGWWREPREDSGQGVPALRCIPIAVHWDFLWPPADSCPQFAGTALTSTWLEIKRCILRRLQPLPVRKKTIRDGGSTATPLFHWTGHKLTRMSWLLRTIKAMSRRMGWSGWDFRLLQLQEHRYNRAVLIRGCSYIT